MARLPRYSIVGHPQHVIVRGNNREPIFCADEDYQFYLEKLELACEKHECEVHAYVLMTNHVHLLITPNRLDSLSKAMQMIGRYYVQYFNYSYRRTGTLWEGRYKATLIDSERYLLTCYRYIELNPIRAAMVNHPSEYPWSSYHHNALGMDNSFITAHDDYLKLGTTVDERLKSYCALFEHQIDEKTLSEIRESTNKAWVLGSDLFKDKIKQQLDRRVTALKRGGDRKSSQYKQSTKTDRV